jgi:hypothetical protein
MQSPNAASLAKLPFTDAEHASPRHLRPRPGFVARARVRYWARPEPTQADALYSQPLPSLSASSHEVVHLVPSTGVMTRPPSMDA